MFTVQLPADHILQMCIVLSVCVIIPCEQNLQKLEILTEYFWRGGAWPQGPINQILVVI